MKTPKQKFLYRVKPALDSFIKKQTAQKANKKPVGIKPDSFKRPDGTYRNARDAEILAIAHHTTFTGKVIFLKWRKIANKLFSGGNNESVYHPFWTDGACMNYINKCIKRAKRVKK